MLGAAAIVAGPRTEVFAPAVSGLRLTGPLVSPPDGGWIAIGTIVPAADTAVALRHAGDGSIVWTRALPLASDTPIAMAIMDGALVLAAPDRWLALDLADGAVLDQFMATGLRPPIDFGGKLALRIGDGGQPEILRAGSERESHRLEWLGPGGRSSWRRPLTAAATALHLAGERALVALADGELLVLDRRSGVLAGAYALPAPAVALALVPPSLVLAIDAQGTVRVLNLADASTALLDLVGPAVAATQAGEAAWIALRDGTVVKLELSRSEPAGPSASDPRAAWSGYHAGAERAAFDRRLLAESAGRATESLVAQGLVAVGAGVTGGSRARSLVQGAAGDLDPTFAGFGVRGAAIAPIGAIDDDQIQDLALQSDGRIVVAGYATLAGGRDVAVARFLPDGTPDLDFGVDGVRTINFGGDDTGAGVALQADGAIVVVGRTDVGGDDDLAVARLTSSGALDLTFSFDGMTRTDVAGLDNAAFDVAIQSDGKIVVAGVVSDVVDDFVVARYHTNGNLDGGFGTVGVSRTDLGGDDEANAVALQTDGKIVVAGRSNPGLDPHFALARYTSAGALDPTFSGDGLVFTDFGGNEGASDLLVQSDGRLVAAGSRQDGDWDFVIARYESSGALDLTFSGDGKAEVGFGGDEFALATALQPDGKIVIAGMAAIGGEVDLALARLSGFDGTLDPLFSGDGRLLLDFGGWEGARSLGLQDDGMLVIGGIWQDPDDLAGQMLVSRVLPVGTLDRGGQVLIDFGGASYGWAADVGPDGRLVAAGVRVIANNGDFALARFDAAGRLDPDFSGDGKTTTTFGADDAAFAVRVQADGKLVAAGATDSSGNDDFALARYTTAGSLDGSFNLDGKVTTSLGGEDVVEALAIQPDGLIVAAGSSEVAGSSNFALARYETDGDLDPAFGGGDGKVLDGFGGDDRAHALALQGDGKVVVAGGTDFSQDLDFALARYLADGTLDATFGSGGHVRTDLRGADDIAYGVAIQGDGKIVVAGSSAGVATDDFALVRYDSGGALDSSFGGGDGMVFTGLGGDDVIYGLALQADGKILVAGCDPGVNFPRFIVARYLSDGSLDASFSGDGVAPITFAGFECASAIAIGSANTIAAAGYTLTGWTTEFAIARLLGGL